MKISIISLLSLKIFQNSLVEVYICSYLSVTRKNIYFKYIKYFKRSLSIFNTIHFNDTKWDKKGQVCYKNKILLEVSSIKIWLTSHAEVYQEYV